MSNEQREFSESLIMHLVLAAIVAGNAVPWFSSIPNWLAILAIVTGATGGLFAASHAWTLHRKHPPSFARGLVECAIIGLGFYATLHELTALGLDVTRPVLVSAMIALPVWLTAYAVYMLAGTLSGEQRETSR